MGRGAEIETLFVLFVLFLIEFGRVAKSENLPARMASQNAVGALRLERHNRDIPGTGTIGGGHAPARQTLERF
jgi:hypothetical protein